MRFWTIIIIVLIVILGIANNDDLLEKIPFNPLGSNMDPKTRSDNDPGVREVINVENEREPYWGRVNYGTLADLKSAVYDENGTEGNQIGEATAIYDMASNASNPSLVTPMRIGLTISTLPGRQPDGSILNSFVFTPSSNSSILAPRISYYKKESVKVAASNKGVITNSVVTDKMKMYGAEDQAMASISVFQIPYGDRFLIGDSTGLVTEAKDSVKMANSINKTLTELSKLYTDNASADKLKGLIFSGNSLSADFQNINNLINSGRYADAYKEGLSSALSASNSGEPKFPAVKIKTDITHGDIYGQFDYIYDYMKNKKGKGVYAPDLVDWASKNVEPVMHLLMTNYMLQSSFKGTGGSYSTPITRNHWNEKNLPFYDDLLKKGKSSKEPFYLYTTINPKVVDKVGKGKTTPTIPVKYIHPDLSHIFGLYNSIMAQVWIGAQGYNLDGATSQIWQDTVADMNKKLLKNALYTNNQPTNANKVSSELSWYSANNLVTGLSTARGTKDRTEEVYPNKEIIGALRVLLSGGDSREGDYIYLNGKKHKITSISSTKYTKTGETSQMYRAFAYNKTNSTWEKWASNIKAASNLPLQPAIFKSHWGKDQAGYIMMPSMLGGTTFPTGIKVMMNDLLKSATEDSKTFDTLSSANRYIMVFNFKVNESSATPNSLGVREIQTGVELGKALNPDKPIVMTGYNGVERFNIVDYFKTQDSLNKGQDKPPIEAKTPGGKNVRLDFMNVLQEFFTANDDTQLTGDGSTVKYAQGFNKQGYIDKYKPEKQRLYIRRTSPNYETFFKAGTSGETNTSSTPPATSTTPSPDSTKTPAASGTRTN